MIFIISGPGGVGKGTVVDRLRLLDPRLQVSRSWTTRRRRSGEADDAYVFVDRETFRRRIDTGGFLEWTEFPGNGHLYGTPVPDVPEGSGTDLVLEIELDGARQVKALDPAAVLIFIVAPSQAEQEERLRGRGDDEESIARRLAVGREEEDLGRALADEVVVNDDVDRAAREVADIIRRRRSA